jgi:hypothetical protein
MQLQFNYRMFSKINYRIWLPFLGGLYYFIVMFHLYPQEFLTIFISISAWGTYSFIISRTYKDPSWTKILIFTLLLFVTSSYFLFPMPMYKNALDTIAVTYCFTYIGAKAGCIQRKCCRARIIRRFLNSYIFNSFNWLQYMEMAITALLGAIIIVMQASFFKAGVAFLIFIWIHCLLKCFAYTFRYYRTLYLKKMIPYLLTIVMGNVLYFTLTS